MKKPNLNNFGKQLKFSKRSAKKQTISEKEIFIQIVDSFSGVWKRSNSTSEAHKINLLEYDEAFYQIIEDLISIKFGLWQSEIILWYIFAREDEEGNIAALKLQIEGKEEAEVVLKTAEDLWEFLKILEEEEKKDNNQQK